MFDQNCLKDQQKVSKSILDAPNNRNFSSKENIKLGDSNFKFEENKLNFRNSSINPNPFLNFKENKTPLLNFKIKERENDKTSPIKINFSREFRTREATEIQESSDKIDKIDKKDKINCSKTEVKIKLNFDEENRNIFSVTSKKSKEASSCFKNIFKKENLFLEKENTFNTYNTYNTYNICNNDYLYIDNQKIGDSISLQNLNVNNIQNDLLNITNNDIQSIKSKKSIKSIKSDSINSNPFDKSFCKSVSSISSKSDFSNILNNSFYSNMSYNGQPISLGSEVRTFSSMSSFSNFTGSISGFSSVYSDYSSYNESNTTNFTSNERAKSFLSFNQSVHSVSHFSSSGNSQNNLITSNTNNANNINSNILDNGNYFKIPELENETEESNYYSRESIGSKDKSDSNENFLEEYEKKLLIPIEKKNDEKYKILKINKFARKTEIPPNKTVRKWEEFITHDNQDYDDSKYIINFYPRLLVYDYNILCKRKKVHSVKRIFASEMKLTCQSNNKVKTFKIFRDCEIGFDPYWQAPLIPNVSLINILKYFKFIF